MPTESFDTTPARSGPRRSTSGGARFPRGVSERRVHECFVQIQHEGHLRLGRSKRDPGLHGKLASSVQGRSSYQLDEWFAYERQQDARQDSRQADRLEISLAALPKPRSE